jgi:serine/threonine-protein kinase
VVASADLTGQGRHLDDWLRPQVTGPGIEPVWTCDEWASPPKIVSKREVPSEAGLTTEYPTLLETLDLPDVEDDELGATIRKVPSDWRDTLRASLPILPVGTQRESQFKIAQVLGQGGMGVVHLAHQQALGRDVAIKTVSDAQRSRDAENALLQEARVMGVIEHPNVVPVHVIGQDDAGRPVIVMKRIDGTTWDDYVEGRAQTDGDDPLGFHLSVVTAVCRALSFAHDRGILHRDIKPENVMIGRFGEVYVLDWGLAVSLEPNTPYIPHAGAAHEVVGTPLYMAPEMARGDAADLGKHTDVFLVGASLYHCVTGEPPNLGRTLYDALARAIEGHPRDYPEDVPSELRAICEKAMAHSPEQRYASIDELREAVEAFASHRNSHELVATARERLQMLKAKIAGGHEDAVHEAFGEAKFGFVSAQQIWPENPEARRGLQACLQTMIEFELTQKNIPGARSLLAQLPFADEKLEARVDALARELEEREAKLVKLAYDYDENVGITARRWVIGAMAAVFAVMPAALNSMRGLVVPEPLRWITDDPVLLSANASALLFVPVLAVLVLATRERLKSHKASRIFVEGLLLMYVVGVGARTTTLWAGVSLKHAAAAESAIFSCGLMMLGLAIDRRLFAAGCSFLLTVPAIMLVAGHTIEIYCAGAVLACLAFLFFQDVRQSAITMFRS